MFLCVWGFIHIACWVFGDSQKMFGSSCLQYRPREVGMVYPFLCCSGFGTLHGFCPCQNCRKRPCIWHAPAQSGSHRGVRNKPELCGELIIVYNAWLLLVLASIPFLIHNIQFQWSRIEQDLLLFVSLSIFLFTAYLWCCYALRPF